jgi:hypothetical protein
MFIERGYVQVWSASVNAFTSGTATSPSIVPIDAPQGLDIS